MADESKNTGARYVSLPGRGRRGVMLRSRLYLGPDHVLSVESNGFTENYKRFYFADIQGIVTRRTTRWIWSASILFLLAAAVFSSIALSIPGIEASRLTLIGALSLLPSVAIVLRGPTCICHMVTAVQKEQLPSLARLRVARKTIGRIKTVVEGMQGAMTAEMREKLLVADDGDHSPEAGKTLESGAGTPPRRDGGLVHAIAFSLLIATSLLWFARSSVSLKTDDVVWMEEIDFGSLFFSASSLLLLVISIVRQRGSDMARAVRGIAWFSFLFLGVCLTFQVLSPSFRLMPVATMPLTGSPYYFVYTFVSIAGCLVLGIFGILAVFGHRRASRETNPTASAEESLP